MADTEVLLVERTPTEAAAPTRTVIGAIPYETLTYQDELNAPGRCDLSVNPDALTSDVKELLLDASSHDPATFRTCELVVIRDDTTRWRGPLVSVGVQGRGTSTVTLTGFGSLYYLAGMVVPGVWAAGGATLTAADRTFTASDTALIARTLVSDWQAGDYANFGIVVGSETSGVTAARTWKWGEFVDLLDAFADLSQVGTDAQRFDYGVDPDTLALVLYVGGRGTDLSGDVFLDARNVTDPGLAWSVAADQFATLALSVGSSANRDRVVGSAYSAAWRAAFGSWAAVTNHDGVSVQATADNHATRVRDERSSPLVVIGPTLTVVSDAEPFTDFGVGDTVTFQFDAGLGLHDWTRRLEALTVQVDATGTETVQVSIL